MKTATQQPRSTSPQLMELLSENSETERALCANSVFFQTITVRRAATTGFHKNAAVKAADPFAGASALDEVA